MSESKELATLGEFFVYAGDDGTPRAQVRMVDGTIWLTQRQLAAVYDKDVRTISEHVRNIFEEGELDPAATVRKFRIVQGERNRTGFREVARLVDHYGLPMILAVGYRVRSAQGTRFRQWATALLEEFARKGFVLDDERMKHPTGAGGPDYFDELLARIRDIRSSEKVFYKKVLEIYATSVDYDARAEASQRFFATVQNKLHYAVHGHTAAEMIAARADADKPHMGMTSWTGARPRRADAQVAKNYLTADELETLNRIVSAYLEFAELQALNRRPMHMADWSRKLDEYLALSDRAILPDAGSVSHQDALDKAQREFDRFSRARAELPAPVETHFEGAIRDVESLAKKRPRRPGPR